MTQVTSSCWRSPRWTNQLGVMQETVLEGLRQEPTKCHRSIDNSRIWKLSTQLPYCSRIFKELLSEHRDLMQFFMAPARQTRRTSRGFQESLHMDIATIMSKLDGRVYVTANEFESDMRLMLRNCHKFSSTMSRLQHAFDMKMSIMPEESLDAQRLQSDTDVTTPSVKTSSIKTEQSSTRNPKKKKDGVESAESGISKFGSVSDMSDSDDRTLNRFHKRAADSQTELYYETNKHIKKGSRKARRHKVHKRKPNLDKVDKQKNKRLPGQMEREAQIQSKQMDDKPRDVLQKTSQTVSTQLEKKTQEPKTQKPEQELYTQKQNQESNTQKQTQEPDSQKQEPNTQKNTSTQEQNSDVDLVSLILSDVDINPFLQSLECPSQQLCNFPKTLQEYHLTPDEAVKNLLFDVDMTDMEEHADMMDTKETLWMEYDATDVQNFVDKIDTTENLSLDFAVADMEDVADQLGTTKNLSLDLIETDMEALAEKINMTESLSDFDETDMAALADMIGTTDMDDTSTSDDMVDIGNIDVPSL